MANIGTKNCLLTRAVSTLISALVSRRSCIPNTRPPGQEMKAGVFLVIGLVFVNFAPATLLVVLNTLIVGRLLVMERPGAAANGVKPASQSDKKTKVNIQGNSHSRNEGAGMGWSQLQKNKGSSSCLGRL